MIEMQNRSDDVLKSRCPGVEGTLCCRATCDQITACLQAVEDSSKKTEYDWVWRSCVTLTDEAMNKCCLRK